MRRFAVTALVSVLLTGCGSHVEGSPVADSSTTTTTTSPAPKAVAPAGLPGLLLSVDDIKSVLPAPTLAVKHSDTKPVTYPQMRHDPPQCTSAVYAGLAQTLGGSGYRAFFGVVMAGTPTILPTVNETVTAFDTDSAAARYATRVAQQWRGCSDKQLVETNPKGQTVTWDIGVVVDTGRVSAVRASVHSGPVVSSLRLVSAKANVVVDLEVVGAGLGEQPRTIMDRILARIPS